MQTRYRDAAMRKARARKHDDMVKVSITCVNVTPKGVQPPALCDASATREGL